MIKNISQQQAISIVLIETNGTIKTLKTKEVSVDTLYKKCGFRINDDFICRHTWKVTLNEEPYYISLWAKKTGKANFENKYDLPPPMDKELFFGTCALVRTASGAGTSEAGTSGAGTSEAGTSGAGSFLDLTKETWLKIYEKLFGGFEDLGDDDDYSEDELANVDPALLTAHGYLKDDFVVSDKEMLESGEVSAEETEVPLKKTKTKNNKKIATVPKKGKAKKTEVDEDNADDTSELEEEVYTFSDDD